MGTYGIYCMLKLCMCSPDVATYILYEIVKKGILCTYKNGRTLYEMNYKISCFSYMEVFILTAKE